jgi:hypothetical protein
MTGYIDLCPAFIGILLAIKIHGTGRGMLCIRKFPSTVQGKNGSVSLMGRKRGKPAYLHHRGVGKPLQIGCHKGSSVEN